MMARLLNPGLGPAIVEGRPSWCEDIARRFGRDASPASFHVTDPVLYRVEPGRELLELACQTVRQVVDRVGQFCRIRGQFLARGGDLPYGTGVLDGQLVIQPSQLRGLKHEFTRRRQVLSQ